jgi:type II secretory pathway pseudopilin PulG
MRLRLRHRLAARDERGFSLVLTVMVMLVVTGLLAGAFDAVFFNTQATRNDLDQKRALLAAEAGLSIYQQQLNNNPNYWDTCPTGGTTGLTGLSVPGSTDNGSTEYYSYKTLPATGSTSCNAASPIPTTIESSGAAAGSFRAQFTGSSGKITRTIVAQFQPPSFLDYIYFTNFEIGDPAALGETGSAAVACTNYYPTRNDNNCGGAINFITGDAINGPMHSNDYLAVCGSPSFGSTSPTYPDTVESPGIADPDNCANAPTINGAAVSASNQPTFTNGAVQLPANDLQLLNVADGGNPAHTNGCYAGAGCAFTGPTTIVLNGNTLNITNASFNGGVTDTGVAWPSNGVIYVQNSTCTATYNPGTVTYGNDAGCGDATVSGNYSSSLTIGSDNDIIINGSLTQTGLSPATAAPSGQNLLGLIANDFVRVAHPVSGTCSFSPYNNSASNSTSGIYSSLTNPVIDAAILALNHSFIVDQFECGNAPLGTLTIWGAIAQNFRGFVGTESNGTVATGYIKNYNYDTRLATLSPPSFINPVTDWAVDRVTECGDASGAC